MVSSPSVGGIASVVVASSSAVVPIVVVYGYAEKIAI